MAGHAAGAPTHRRLDGQPRRVARRPPRPARRRAPRRPRRAPAAGSARAHRARPRGAGACGARARSRSCSSCSALLGAGAYLALQSVYFIGTNSRGLVTLYRGPALSTSRASSTCTAASYVSGVSASTLSARTPAQRCSTTRCARKATPPRWSAASNWDSSNEARGVNRPIVRLYGLVARAVRAARRVHLALDDLRSLLAARKHAQRAPLLEQRADRPRPDPRRRRHRARAQRARRRRRLPAHLSRRANSSPHAIGYSYITDLGSTGLERFRNTELNGQNAARTCRAILDQLQGKKPRGDKVVTTLDPARAAGRDLGARRTRGRGRRARTAQRRGHGDGLDARAIDPNALRSPAPRPAKR